MLLLRRAKNISAFSRLLWAKGVPWSVLSRSLFLNHPRWSFLSLNAFRAPTRTPQLSGELQYLTHPSSFASPLITTPPPPQTLSPAPGLVTFSHPYSGLSTWNALVPPLKSYLFFNPHSEDISHGRQNSKTPSRFSALNNLIKH